MQEGHVVFCGIIQEKRTNVNNRQVRHCLEFVAWSVNQSSEQEVTHGHNTSSTACRPLRPRVNISEFIFVKRLLPAAFAGVVMATSNTTKLRLMKERWFCVKILPRAALNANIIKIKPCPDVSLCLKLHQHSETWRLVQTNYFFNFQCIFIRSFFWFRSVLSSRWFCLCKYV